MMQECLAANLSDLMLVHKLLSRGIISDSFSLRKGSTIAFALS